MDFVPNTMDLEILTQVAKQLLGHPPVPMLPARSNAKIAKKKRKKTWKILKEERWRTMR